VVAAEEAAAAAVESLDQSEQFGKEYGRDGSSVRTLPV
jgi:hypothetical protein